MSLDNIEKFRMGINACAKTLDRACFIPKSEILGELETISPALLPLLEKFEPYGEKNPRPRFLLQNAHCVAVKLFGADKSHSRLELRPLSIRGETFEFVAFRRILEMPHDRTVNLTYTVNKNEFNGKTSMQLMVERLF